MKKKQVILTEEERERCLRVVDAFQEYFDD